MRTRRMLAIAGVAFAIAGCNSFLDVQPVDELPPDKAVVGAIGARVLVTGIYDALQDDNYYGGDYVLMSDLSSDDVEHAGTFTTYGDADDNILLSTNGTVEAIYNAIYAGIGRADLALKQLPTVTELSVAERNRLMGESYFLRALMFHDAVKLFGGMNPGDLGVPLALEPVSNPSNAPKLARATVAEVYTQILSDLTQAEALLPATGDPTRANDGAVVALRARVEMFRGNFAAGESLSTKVITAYGYDINVPYAAEFSEEGTPTDEDIFKVSFDAVDFSNVGYYYLGRYEVTPTLDVISAFQPGFDESDPYNSFAPPDDRAAQILWIDDEEFTYSYKFPTTAGAEDFPVLRLAEMYLIRAEARARQNKLQLAIDDINVIRGRAGATLVSLGAMTQAQVIDLAIAESRLEFAFEGHRWFDLRRTGKVAAYLVSQGAVPTQDRYPIPESEVIVAGTQQNPGY